MQEPSNENILSVIRVSREMMLLADKGDMDRKDDGCGVLYGTLRDAAYKLRKLAEKERDAHISAGKWKLEDAPIGDESENT